MRLHRLVAILLLLESRGRVKARELARALETSERSIYRDIEALCESGVPIRSEAGPAGGFSLMEGYSLPRQPLQGDEVVSLYLSGMGIRPDADSEASLVLQKTLLSLEKELPSEYRGDLRRAKARFHFDPRPWWREKTPLRHLDTLRQALWKSEELIIRYRKESKDQKEVVERRLRPYGMVVKASEWYLVAFDIERRGMRAFRCDRVEAARIVEGSSFLIPEAFSLEAFWEEWLAEFEGIIREAGGR
jgi:predicted DNA-binding transcriptional regulator YafY